MELEIVKPGTSSRYLKLLVYGRPGVGKTKLLGTAADDPATFPLLLDVEAGTMTLAGHHSPDIVPIRTWSQFNDVYNYLTTEAEKAAKYKTIGFDSLTEMRKMQLGEVMRTVAATNASRDVDVPSQHEYTKVSGQIQKLVRYFRALPYHLVLTALEQESKNEATGEITVKPSLGDAAADAICGYMDVVGRLIVSQEGQGEQRVLTRHLVVQPMGNYVAKDRSGKLGLQVSNPTIPQIIKTIYGDSNAQA